MYAIYRRMRCPTIDSIASRSTSRTGLLAGQRACHEASLRLSVTSTAEALSPLMKL